MPFKTPTEKLRTKINNTLSNDQDLKEVNNSIKIDEYELFKHSNEEIIYSKTRYWPQSINRISQENYETHITLNHDNLKILNSNIVKVPTGVRVIVTLFKSLLDIELELIHIGGSRNKIDGNKIYITTDLYNKIIKIDKEERSEKNLRLSNRSIPFINSEFQTNIATRNIERDYSLLLQEVISSGNFTQQDILDFSENLETGEKIKIVIEKQIDKQVKWLIENIEKILDVTSLKKPEAQILGNSIFGYTKASILGGEDLMEKILADYGKNSIFGVPALLNINQYVTNPHSKIQFDLLLVNHLGDIEIVELKKPDVTILNYDHSRGKFYPSKDLSIAIGQSERYLTAVYKDNDDDYKIDGKKIREFIQDEVGGTLFTESIRPNAIIIIGSEKTLIPNYDKFNSSQKSKITEANYRKNGEQAYREISNSFKNIKILNYSELLASARTRLETS